MRELVFATHNRHKLEEIAAAFPAEWTLLSLDDVGFTAPIEETGQTLEENALLKARTVHASSGKDVFADDTGLEVEALNGAPGVYSARYAGEEGNSEKNIAKLLGALCGLANRKARFRTVIALILDGKEYLFEGKVEGEILQAKDGESGFGYDPVFQPEGYDRSFARMTLAEKNAISHRGKALRELAGFLAQA